MRPCWATVKYHWTIVNRLLVRRTWKPLRTKRLHRLPINGLHDNQLHKYVIIFILALVWCTPGYGQQIQVEFNPGEMDSARYYALLYEFGNRKALPSGYERQALIALSFYPELKNIKIKFKLKKGGAPFSSRPVVWDSFFKKSEKRTYLVFLRTQPFKAFNHLHLPAIPYNALIGVLGHELAHTADFTKQGFGGMFGVMTGNLSRKYLDRFEFETDRRTIEHGLGFQLLAWNEYGFGFFDAGSEATPSTIEKMLETGRYMRPETIKKLMTSLPDYISCIQVLYQ